MYTPSMLLSENELEVLFPESYYLLGVIFLLVCGVLMSSNNSLPVGNTIGWLCVLMILIDILIIANNPLTDCYVLSNTLIVDSFSVGLKTFLLLCTGLCILISLYYTERERINNYEIPLLIVLSSLSMMLMVSSNDMISMYLTIELQTLCFYVLAASKSRELFSTEAGLKYFVLGSLSSGILLFGCCLIYGLTGIIQFDELSKFITTGPVQHSVFIGMVFLLSGLLFKISAVPFHMWSPDVYEGSPTNVTAFFSIAPKLAILSLLVRIFSFLGEMNILELNLIICSVASMVVGGFTALGQAQMKRLLAYSSIGHVGYILIAVCCATVESIHSAIFYLLIYIIMIGGIFGILLSILTEDKQYHSLKDFQLLGRINPSLALGLTLMLFSLAGIPPLAGFLTKLSIFFSAMESTQYVLSIVGILMSCVSCFYSLKIIKHMYFENETVWKGVSCIKKINALIISIFSIIICVLWIDPCLIIEYTYKLSLSLSTPPIN